MFTLLVCHRRARGVSYGAFAEHFRGPRRALVVADQVKLGFSTYRQLIQVPRTNLLYQGVRMTRIPPVTALVAGHPLRALKALSGRPPRLADEAWDAVEELEYPSRDALVSALSTRDAQRVADRLVADQANISRRTAVVVTECFLAVPEPAVPGAGRTATLFFLRAVPGSTRADMLEHWGTSHRELFISLRPTLRYDEYAQLHVRSGPDVSAAARALGDAGGPEFDGIAKVGYASATSIAACFASPAALAANVRLVRDEVTFIDGHRSVLVYGGR